MFYLCYKLLRTFIRFIGYKKSVIILMLCIIYLPHYAEAQLDQSPPFIFEVSASYETRQAYVHPVKIPTSFNYDIKFEHSFVFVTGTLPLIYKAGFFLEERQTIDPRIITRVQLYNETTLGRLFLDTDNSNAYYVVPENFVGTSYRQRFFSDWFALEMDIKQDLEVQDSHGGLQASFGFIGRFAQISSAKLYFSRHVYYGDENYNYAWFSVDERYADRNVEIKEGLYETVDKITTVTALTRKQFITVELLRAKLLNTPVHSIAVLNTHDNGFKIAYTLQF